MNPEDFSRDDLLRDVSPLILGGCLLLCGILWLSTWLLRKKWSSAKLPVTAIGFILISATFWIAFQLLGHWFALATSWSLIFLALLAGLAWEAILWIYQFEKGLVTQRRGRCLLALRLATLTTIITILAQPVRSFLEEREINREIAVLLDDSESMHLSDQRLSYSEILDRASIFGSEVVATKRPRLREIRKQTGNIKIDISTEIDAIAAAPSAASGLESRAESLPEVFEKLRTKTGELEALLTDALSKPLSGNDKNQLNQYLSLTRNGISDRLKLAEDSVVKSDPAVYILKLNETVVELDKMLQSIDSLTARVDEQIFRSFTQAERDEVNRLALKPRVELATKAATGLNGGFKKSADGKPATLLEKLGEKYNIRYYKFNRDIEEVTSLSDTGETEVKAKAVRAQTDLTGAVEHVLENSSPESLAGILLFSDGQHNTANLPEDSLRQLAIQNSPLCAIPVGGNLGPVDTSILSLNAPESIYLDDRVVIRAVAKMDGLLGKQIRAQLVTNDRIVDEQTINVTDVNFRSEVRFVHTPEEKGIIDYQVRLEADPREIFKNNNSWEFKVAVTDDRTNVLLVDGYPRWEFRYLRNLFYGRDKSVHLQYVLLNPDSISGMRTPPPVAASATRKFGDAEATQLPRNADEWQLFDVIILGDINPNQLSNLDWKAIEESVTRRGALLVCVAGPRHMPHSFKSDVLKDLLPVTFPPTTSDAFDSPEEAYRIALTTSGKSHPITSQSTSRSLNQELWSGFPLLRWRWQSGGVKEGSEVLAYAEPRNGSQHATNSPIGSSPDSIEAAIERLTHQKEMEKQNALITTMRSGLGKVVMMNFDRTWRFRYGVGDTYHHRFWGQMTRWGAGPNLRSGNETIRLGTDRLSYTPSDDITVTAKVLDDSRKPITDANVFANVYKDGKRLSRQKLSYRSDTSGLYETTFPGFSDEGEYKIELEGSEIDKAIKADGTLQSLETELLVVTTRNPVELAELTANRDFLTRASRQTNGRTAELWELDTLLNAFGAPKEILTERRDVTLWDTWPLLAAFLGFLTAEWIIRRRSGLV
ncbi:MAG: hypothetical protein P1V20_28455 [Verrucomicrobiales bacterium]|nr:hypothetical protein [Verrucomicrobiales bacterium]